MRRDQVHHLLSHQISLNQGNQNREIVLSNGEIKAAKGQRDRAASKKSANSSVLVV